MVQVALPVVEEFNNTVLKSGFEHSHGQLSRKGVLRLVLQVDLCYERRLHLHELLCEGVAGEDAGSFGRPVEFRS